MRTAVYLLGLAALVPIILYRPWVGIAAWTFLGIINPQAFVWGWAEQVPYALIVGGTTLLGLLLTKERRSIPVNAQTVVLGLLAAWFTVTTFVAWAPVSAWEQWNKVFKILLMTFVAMILIHGEYRIRTLVVAVAAAMGLLGVKGGIFTILSGGEHRVLGPGGFLKGNTEIGLALAMTLPLMVALAVQQQKRWARWGVWAAFWLSSLATVFTYSRGALLGLAAVLFALFLGFKRKALIVMMLIPALVLFLPLVPEKLFDRAATIESYQQDRSAMGRIQAWGVAWNVATSRFTGGGFNLDRIEPAQWLSYASPSTLELNNYKTLAAHSIYFQVLGDHGFIGLILFLTLLLCTWRALGEIQQEAKKDLRRLWIGQYAWALRIALIAYGVSGAFLSLAYFDLFYTVVALSVVMQREVREISVAPATSGATMRPARFEGSA